MSALRAAFDEERAWLRDCDDQRAVLDRMAGYRDNLASARRNGNTEAHAVVEQLIELAEDRLTELKAAALRAKHRPASPPSPPPRAVPPSAPTEPPAAVPARADDSDLVRRLQTQLAASVEAQRRAVQDREDAERRARAAQEREAARASHDQSTINRGGEIAPFRPSVPRPVGGSGARLDLPPTLVPGPPCLHPSTRPPPTHPTAVPSRPLIQPAMSPARPTAPPPSPPRSARPVAEPARTPLTVLPATLPAPSTSDARPDGVPAGGHATRTPPPAAPLAHPGPALTGADLAAFRRGVGLTQVAAAQRLGVTQGTISKAEGNPRAVLGPALAEALRRAGA